MVWRSERSRNGGVDRVPVEGVAGTLHLAGKHFVGPDPEDALRRTEADVVVCLNERHELIDRYPHYVTWLGDNGGTRAHWHPIPDLHAPGLDEALTLLATLRTWLDEGRSLLVHCGAGIGRAGTIAAGILVVGGESVDGAIERVAASRPMAGPEAGAQRQMLDELAGQVGSSSH